MVRANETGAARSCHSNVAARPERRRARRATRRHHQPDGQGRRMEVVVATTLLPEAAHEERAVAGPAITRIEAIAVRLPYRVAWENLHTTRAGAKREWLDAVV